eukprot:TRINITY_DN14739_c1_g1_i2.p1 TRINITY_DN14739_c1_g1~~TRINITY_DN14739_c1_g1_i2.p1  ORF type:complete len:510 (+),score=97.06 TRINITY_DN14739_c1_g1_i2:46-1530(+)
MGTKRPSFFIMARLVRLSSVHTFTFCCCLGGLLMALVGGIGWASVDSEPEFLGTCRIGATTPGLCQCAEYEKTGVGSMCVGVEAAFPTASYTAHDMRISQSTCFLKLGRDTLSDCLDTSATFGTFDIPDIRSPPALEFACKLHGDTRNCFLESESLPNHQDESYYVLLIGGSIWGGLCLCLLLLSFALEGYRSGFSYVNLMKDYEEAIEGEDGVECDFMSGNMMCSDLPGDIVAVKTSGKWKLGEIHSREKNKYKVRCDGEMLHDVDQSEIRSGGLKEGMWVVTAEEFHDIPAGVMGTIYDINGNLSVRIAGNSFPAEVGKVVPTPQVLAGQTVEVRNDPCDSWKEGIVESIHGDGVIKVVLNNATEAETFIWIRRPYGLQVESRIMKEKEPQDGTFVFVDPGGALAPTVMTSNEVKLFGGVREISNDIAIHRGAVNNRLIGASALLSASHLVAQHLDRQERALRNVCADQLDRKVQPEDDGEEAVTPTETSQR